MAKRVRLTSKSSYRDCAKKTKKKSLLCFFTLPPSKKKQTKKKIHIMGLQVKFFDSTPSDVVSSV